VIRRNLSRQQLVQTLLLVAIVLAGAVLCAGVIASTASAQAAGNESTGNATDVVEQLGDLQVHDYHYDGDSETMTIDATWRGEVPETLTLTEMIELDDGGATEITFKTVRLLPDSKTEIEVAAKQRSGGTAAVMLTTPQSVDANNAIVLQAGDSGTAAPVPFNAAAGLILLAATGGGLGTFALTKKRREYDEDDWGERVA